MAAVIATAPCKMMERTLDLSGSQSSCDHDVVSSESKLTCAAYRAAVRVILALAACTVALQRAVKFIFEGAH